MERLVRIAFFIAGCEAGILWRFGVVGAGPDGIVSVALFSPLILAVAIGVATLGASGVLRLTKSLGLHGRISMEPSRLTVADKTAFDLNGSLAIDGWQATGRLGGRLRLPYLDTFRSLRQSADGNQRWAWAAVVRLSQGGSAAAVCASLPAGRKSDPGPAGLQLPVAQPSPPAKPCYRLAPDDLVEFVAAVRSAAGRPMSAAPSGERKAGPDPRSLFRSWTWVLGVSVALVVLAVIPPVVQIMNFEPKPVDAAAAEAARMVHQMKSLKARRTLERRIAARELGVMGRKAAPALEALRKIAAEDPDPGVREDAAEAVQSIERSMAKP